jgi:hypothetical protein
MPAARRFPYLGLRTVENESIFGDGLLIDTEATDLTLDGCEYVKGKI